MNINYPRLNDSESWLNLFVDVLRMGQALNISIATLGGSTWNELNLNTSPSGLSMRDISRRRLVMMFPGHHMHCWRYDLTIMLIY